MVKTKRFSRINLVQKYFIIVVLIILGTVMSFLSPHFLTFDNILNVLRQVSMIAIASYGVTLLIISGGLDLSQGGVVALSGIVAAKLASSGQIPITLSMIIGIFCGIGIGIFNGAITVGGRINPVIVTIGTMYIARGLAYLISGGNAIVTGITESFKFIGRGRLGIVPIPIIVMIILFIFYHILLNNTIFGKYTYAVGGNLETARLSGVAVNRHKFILYINAGFLSGIAGIIMASRLASGQPTAGAGFEFDVVVAALIGGTSLAGGEGSILGTMIGALIVGVLRNGLNLLGVHTFYQYLFQGGILIFVIMLDSTMRDKGVLKIKFLKKYFQ